MKKDSENTEQLIIDRFGIKTIKGVWGIIYEFPDKMSQSIKEPPSTINQMSFNDTIKIFISHSSQDTRIADLLVTLIAIAFNLPKKLIRCTSIPGSRLPGGTETAEQLLTDIKEAKVFIALLTEQSIESMYVLCEIGARWAVGGYTVPIIGPNCSFSILKPPISQKHALQTSKETDMQQLIHEISQQLNQPPQPPQAYNDHLKKLIKTKNSPLRGR